MAELKVLVWNVRNLLEGMTRQGVQASPGVTLGHRLDIVYSVIHNSDFDIAILIELGIDDEDHVVSLLTITHPYTNFVTTNINGESIGILIKSKPDLHVCNLNTFIILDGHRHVPRFRVKFSGLDVDIAAVHAPYTAGRNIRSEYFKVLLDKPTIADIICGDFNTMRNEIEATHKMLMHFNFTSKGPFSKDGITPAATSLKSMKSIFDGKGIESQPYDQVWCSNSFLENFEIETKIYEINWSAYIDLKTLHLRIKAIGDAVVTKDKQYGKRGDRNFNKTKDEINESFNDLDTIFENIKKILIVDPLFKNSVDIIDVIYTTMCSEVKTVEQEKKIWSQLPVQLKDSLLIFTEFYKWLKIQGVQTSLDAALYQYAVSDHFPISFTIKLKSASKGKRPRPDKKRDSDDEKSNLPDLRPNLRPKPAPDEDDGDGSMTP